MFKIFLLFLLLTSQVLASSNYQKIKNKINKIQNSSTSFEKFVLGKNDQGEDIVGLVFKGSSQERTKHLVVSTHHGNEVLSADLSIKFLEYLSGPGKKRFKNDELYIVPVLNIGGYNREDREEKDALGKSHDPNRDYPDPCIKKKDFNLKSTSHLANFVRTKNIIGAVTIHGYYGSLTYPWGIYSDNFETLDHQIFKRKAKEAVRANSYDIGTHADILYPAGGAFEDWAYFELGIWSFLVELENRPNWKNDVEMLAKTIENFPKTRSRDHRHLGRCTQTKDLGISRP